MEGSTYRNIYTNRYHDTTKRFQGFVKLFMVWKGSVIKLIWHDLLVFIVGYFTVSLLYQHVFLYHEAVAQYFEMICIYCEKYINLYFQIQQQYIIIFVIYIYQGLCYDQNSFDIFNWILCYSSGEQILGPIYESSMAGSHCLQIGQQYSWNSKYNIHETCQFCIGQQHKVGRYSGTCKSTVEYLFMLNLVL